MTAVVVGVLGFLAFMLTLVVVAYRSDRGPVPRRREVNRLRADLATARTVIHEIDEKIELWRPSLDDVGLGLAQDLRTLIQNHHRSALGSDGNSGNKSD